MTHGSFDDFILHVDAIHSQNVIAEVECLKTPLLSQQNNQRAAGPVESFTKQLPVM